MKHLDRDEIAAELHRQIDAYEKAMGRSPDFLDGHQHVQQLPVVRDAVFEVFLGRLAPNGAWLRYPAMPAGDALIHGVAIARTWAIGALGRGFRAAGARLGIPGNGTFRGVRGSGAGAPFAVLLRRFLRGLGERPLIMCHPGYEADPFVADGEAALAARRDEHAFLASDAFPALLEEHGFRLAGLRR